MSRLEILTTDSMTAEQRRVHDETVAGRRGRMPAPLAVWLRSPTLADRAQKLGEFVRYHTVLPPRLSELAILIVARTWSAQYEWDVHRSEALKAGLNPAIIDAIAQREQPRCDHRDEEVVVAFAASLLQTHVVTDAAYGAAIEVLGEQATVELVGLLGYYTLIAMTLNAFQIDPPAGESLLPP